MGRGRLSSSRSPEGPSRLRSSGGARQRQRPDTFMDWPLRPGEARPGPSPRRARRLAVGRGTGGLPAWDGDGRLRRGDASRSRERARGAGTSERCRCRLTILADGFPSFNTFPVSDVNRPEMRTLTGSVAKSQRRKRREEPRDEFPIPTEMHLKTGEHT